MFGLYHLIFTARIGKGVIVGPCGFILVSLSSQPIDLGACVVALHVFQLNEGDPSSETLEEETENITAATQWVLPAGAWALAGHEVRGRHVARALPVS